MSIDAVSSVGKTPQNTPNLNEGVLQLLLSLLSGQNTQNTNSIFGFQGYPDVLGANNALGLNSIFNTGANNALNATGINSTAYGGGLDSFNMQPLTSAADEAKMANIYSSSVNTVLGMKIPPIPKAKK